MHFERAVRRTRAIQLTSLIDVMMFLLVFFMLTTTFVKTESLELTLPGSGGGGKLSDGILQIYVTQDGKMYAGRMPVEEKQLPKILKKRFAIRPDLAIQLLSGPGVTVQQLVAVMDRIYLSGGKNVSVASWKPGEAG